MSETGPDTQTTEVVHDPSAGGSAAPPAEADTQVFDRSPEKIGEELRAIAAREDTTDSPDDTAPGSALERISNEAGEEPPLDPATETCPTCKGWGETLTGSLVEQYAKRMCVTCNGNGYRDKPVSVEASVDPTEADKNVAARGWGY